MWLDERSNSFDAWAQETGLAERRDFTAGSLDVLEKLVRSGYRDEEDIHSGRMDVFLQ